jgi:hypothetical protein
MANELAAISKKLPNILHFIVSQGPNYILEREREEDGTGIRQAPGIRLDHPGAA